MWSVAQMVVSLYKANGTRIFVSIGPPQAGVARSHDSWQPRSCGNLWRSLQTLKFWRQISNSRLYSSAASPQSATRRRRRKKKKEKKKKEEHKEEEGTASVVNLSSNTLKPTEHHIPANHLYMSVHREKHIYVPVYVCIYVCMYVCMYIYMYLCMSACMYVSMYFHVLSSVHKSGSLKPVQKTPVRPDKLETRLP